jgi:LytTr DNA-binding domain
MTFDKYLENRRTWEFAIAAGIVLMSLFANLGVVWMEFARRPDGFDAWEPWVLEGTSHLGMAVIIPIIIWFDGHFPIRACTWKRSLPAHALFSVVASLIHVTIMYWCRNLLYRIYDDGNIYQWDNWLREFSYEYLKDFRTYMLIIIFVYLYRFVILRLQGEAGFIDEGQEDDATKAISDRFLVKKLGREFLVKVEEIDWIESSGNYVNLHVRGRVYPLRDTMTNISERLNSRGFQRVHRSAIVNLDRVAEIVAFDTGDGEARLQSDIKVPVSRRFKKELRERLG